MRRRSAEENGCIEYGGGGGVRILLFEKEMMDDEMERLTGSYQGRC